MHFLEFHRDIIESILARCTIRTYLAMRRVCRRVRQVATFTLLLRLHGYDDALGVRMLPYERRRDVVRLSRDRVKVAYYVYDGLWSSRTYRRGRLVDIRWYLAGQLHQRVRYRPSGHFINAYGDRHHARWYFRWDNDRAHPPNGLHVHRWLVREKITPEYVEMMFPEDIQMITHSSVSA